MHTYTCTYTYTYIVSYRIKTYVFPYKQNNVNRYT